MAGCEFKGECLFFNKKMPVEDTLWNLFSRLYCQNSPGKCAIQRVGKALGWEKVPTRLYPNMDGWAGQLIEENRL